MVEGPFRTYKHYKIVLKPILSDSPTNAVKFYLEDFLQSIPQVWAHEKILCRANKQSETTRSAARKFLTNLVCHLSNRRLVSRVLETKIEKCRRCAIPQAWELTYIFQKIGF